MRINLIVAGVPISTKSGLLGIGYRGTIPWLLPEDLQYFKRLTLGHVVIMGRRTWESLPERYRPLPGRGNIVVTASGDARNFTGACVARTLEEAMDYARMMRADESVEVFLIGGAELYRTYLTAYPRGWHYLYLTRVRQGRWLSAYDTYFNLDWIPNRVVKTIVTTPAADYEVYACGSTPSAKNDSV